MVGFLCLLAIAAIAAKATAGRKKPRVSRYIERVFCTVLGRVGIGTAESAIEV